jgi:PPOX class probable F420-dependent enzyme
VPKPPLPEKLSQLLAKPNPSVITALRQDGQPVSVATWYLWEDGKVLVNLDESRKRLDYLRNDPRISITVLDGDDWGTHVSMQGRVISIAEDPELVDIDRISRHYGGGAYPNRTGKRISAWIEIDRYHGWGAAA